MVLALGATTPIPRTYGKDVRNLYSEKDVTYHRFGKILMGSPDYNIQVVQSISPKNQLSFFGGGDHGRMNETYKRSSLDVQNLFDEKYHYLRIGGR